MAARIPMKKLANGREIPAVGLGTWQAPKGVVKQAVMDAIDAGYRHIDCAFVYGNEAEIGEALTAKLSEGKVKREDLFITSKLWNTYHSHDKVSECLGLTLKNLQLTYLDLYLIHWPMGYLEGGETFPKDDNGKFIYSNVDFIESWKAMEELVQKGLIRSIGMSNFNSQQIDRVLKVCKIKPTVVQVECHPFLNQENLIKFCSQNGIQVTAYSPLGAPANPWAQEGDPSPMKEEAVIKVGEKYGKSPAQVMLKYQLQRGLVIIPKSVSKERIHQNLQLFDFTLTDEDMKTINGLNRNRRVTHLEWVKDHPHYPFSIPY
jgi:aldehyde reductase